MKFRSDSFYISLVIFQFIDVGRTSSDDRDRKWGVEWEKHRWTVNEEAKLIFFDVSTDTGKMGHFNRIKKEWHREYPGSNVTDIALYHKIRELRQNSMEEGELKKTFKWNPKLHQELIDVYHTTRPYIKNANTSLNEEWKRRHPDFRATARYLLWRVRNVFKNNGNLRYKSRGSSRASSHVEDQETAGEIKHQWTKIEKATLLRIDELTDKEKPGYVNRIILKWREEFPDSHLTDIAILTMLRRLRRASKKLELQAGSSKNASQRWKEYLPRKKSLAEISRGQEEAESGKRSGKELQAETSKERRQKCKKYSRKLRSLEKPLGVRGRIESGKRHGKAPMEYSSDESASSSPPMRSEDSE